MDLQDAADDSAVVEHIVIVIVPHARRSAWGGAFENPLAHVARSIFSMSRPLQSSFHLAMAARLCVHALADREAFAPQDSAALVITLDHSGGRLLFSSGG